MDKIAQLLKLAEAGPIRTRDLNSLAIPRAYLQRLCDRGVLERVDRGLYRRVEQPVTELHSLALVAKRLPQATICLLSALQVHELTTEIPYAVWITIGRHDRKPQISYPQLEVVRASGLARTYGIESRQIEGVPVRLTTPAKTVADCFRFRRHVGLDVAIAALKDYFATSKGEPTKFEQSLFEAGDGYGYGDGAYGHATSRGDGYGDPKVYSMDSLVEAARADRVLTLMRPYMEALA